MLRDIRYALRSFRRQPTFTLVALVSLAIGVGANCAAFSWADALLLRPLPVPRPSELIAVGSATTLDGALASLLNASYVEYEAIRDRARSFNGVLAFNTISGGLAATADGAPVVKIGEMVTANFFDVAGVRPAFGRGFRPSENEVPDRDAVIVLSDRLWRTHFAADPAILGRPVYLLGTPFTVIGVAPPGFLGLETFVQADFFIPLMMSGSLLPPPNNRLFEVRDARYLGVRGRLASGATTSGAEAELAAVAAELARTYPDTHRGRRFVARTELQARIAQMPPIATLIALLTTLAAATLFVACANVAGLLTSRAPARARELAVRAAIGAGRAGLVRQLMTESLLLAGGGGVLGLAVGYASIALFQQIRIPTDLPIALTFSLDRRALLFGLVVAVTSALLFGLAPAIRASRVDLTSAMKAADAGAAVRRAWGRSLLVVGQVAVSVVVLAIALFTYRAFRQDLGQGTGYRIDNLLMMSFDTGLVRDTDAASRRFYDRLLERVRALPDVRSATLTSAVPMQTVRLNITGVLPEGYELPPGTDAITVMSARVAEGFFSTMRIPIVAGREFRIEDSADAPEVVVVNELFARRYWPGQDAVGKRLLIRRDANRVSRLQVVGVAATSRYLFLAEPPTEYLYLPFRQDPSPAMILLAESAADPTALVAPLRDAARSVDPRQPIFDIRSMEEFYRISTVGLMNVIIGTIGGMGIGGLALSIVGLYGLVAYAASRRTREIGIRVALGADRGSVLRMIMRQGVALAVLGLMVGVAASVATGELLAAAFAAGDEPRDTTALMIVSGVVLTATALGAYVPARRASRLNPLSALRQD
jgi:macrolide transport system ATP-binding/permease protein